MADCYKIKLRGVGYRRVYRVDEEVVFVTVIAVGRRDRRQVYDAAQTRWAQPIHNESEESHNVHPFD